MRERAALDGGVHRLRAAEVKSLSKGLEVVGMNIADGTFVAVGARHSVSYVEHALTRYACQVKLLLP